MADFPSIYREPDNKWACVLVYVYVFGNVQVKILTSKYFVFLTLAKRQIGKKLSAVSVVEMHMQKLFSV